MRRDYDSYEPPTVRGPLFERDAPFANSRHQPTPDEILIGGLIWRRKGQANPISIARLKETTGLSERQIKGIVEQLVVSHKMRIGGRREEPAGYFMIESPEDLEVAIRSYRRQFLSMAKRIRVLEGKTALRELYGQLQLED